MLYSSLGFRKVIKVTTCRQNGSIGVLSGTFVDVYRGLAVSVDDARIVTREAWSRS